MYLHRIIELAPFVADPDWSALQEAPAVTIAGSLIQADSSGGIIYWTAIPYDGGDVASSRPSSGVGMTFDARLVYLRPAVYDGPNTSLVIGRKSPGENAGAPIATGLEINETMPARGTAGTLQMISVAAVPPGTTHLWLFWSFESRGRA